MYVVLFWFCVLVSFAFGVSPSVLSPILPRTCAVYPEVDFFDSVILNSLSLLPLSLCIVSQKICFQIKIYKNVHAHYLNFPSTFGLVNSCLILVDVIVGGVRQNKDATSMRAIALQAMKQESFLVPSGQWGINFILLNRQL